MNFVEELRWRGMIHDMTPGTEEQLLKGMTAGYIGFDPTSDSLHVGSLAQIMTLIFFQRAGHKPFALVGGATGMVGDPAGKSQERNLLDLETLRYNESCIRTQLEKFLDFDCGGNSAEMVNNYDWFKDYNFLHFIRDVGKHITVNYMMAKDSVQSRLDSGMSFTEFSYQLIQGYDFYYLWKNRNCLLQMGGSDQWGNIVTGTELIRRMEGGNAWALTTKLINKADGSKFGKTESGNVWLDRNKTSPYAFYQFWMNTSDEDAASFIKIFTLKNKDEIDALIAEHLQAPHERKLQKALAQEITTRVHGDDDYRQSVKASEILFGKGTKENLASLSEEMLLSIFEGVPRSEISRELLNQGIPVVDLLSTHTNIFPSKGEARRMLKDGGIMINKEKAGEELVAGKELLLNDRYMLVQKGKKNYYLVIVK